MTKKKHRLHNTGVACFGVLVLSISAAAQSVVNTFNFSPPGVTNNVGFDFEVAVVHSTGLVYVGATGAYGNEVGVIDPTTNSVLQVISTPTPGALDFARVNQATGLIYFRQPNSNIAVVDGRPSSSTFNQALPSLTLPGRVIQSFALDESRGLLYVTNSTNAPVQSRVRIIDVNPASSTFHQALNEVSMPANALARGVAVNRVTNKIYIGVTGPGVGGVYMLDGASLSLALIPGTGGAFGVIVNENANLVYATGQGNLMRAIDGATDTALAAIAMPGLISTAAFENIALHTWTGRVYVKTSDSSTPAKLVVVDGDRLSPTFNTVLAAINVGRAGGGDVVVDESLNRIITTSLVDKKTSIVDGASNAVIATIPSTQSPSDVAIDPVSHRAYVANQLNFVQEIDVSGATLTATILTAAEAGLGVVNPVNHLFYTTRTVDTTDLPIFNKCGLAGVVTGQPHNSGRYVFPAVNRITNRVYAGNSGATLTGDTIAPGFVSVIDGSTNSVITNVLVGDQPFGNAVNEITNKIYVLNAGLLAAGSISVIDGATNTALSADTSAFGPQASFAGDVVVNETTNKVYFQANGLPGGIGVLDGTTNVATPLPSSLGPVSIIRVNKVLNRTYVGTSTGLLHVLDGATDALITQLTVGSPITVTGVGRPNFIAINELTGQVFVSDFNGDRVFVIDGATNSIIATIPVGDGPTGMTVNELSNRVYVANANDNTISFIDAESLAVESTLGLSLRPARLEADAAVSRVYVSTSDAPVQSGIVIVSDLDGTFDALRQTIVAATVGDPPGIRNSMQSKVADAEAAVDRGDPNAAVNKLDALASEVKAQRGKRLTEAETTRILALISAAVNSVC